MKVLIMHSDKALANAITDGLADAHYHFHYATDGEVGLEMVTNIKFDLIVLEWDLPKSNGLSVLKKLRLRKISTPILMVTADESVRVILESLDSGANDCVIKPFEAHVLIARMKALIRRSKWDLCEEISHDHV